MARSRPVTEQRAPRPAWVTGLRYVLLAFVAVVVIVTVVMMTSVYFRRRW